MAYIDKKIGRYSWFMRSWLRNWVQESSTSGLLFATLFFAFSLTPSLLPRGTIYQGLVSGMSLTFGYLLGWTTRRLWSYLELPEPSQRVHRIVLSAAAIVFAGVAAVFLWQASEWQNSIRSLMEMEPVETVRPFTVALIALVMFIVALFVGRWFRRTFHFFSLRLKRFLPRRVAHALGLALAALIFWSFIEGVVVSAVLRAADNTYQQLDALVPEDIKAPVDPAMTGSPASLIDWRDLGRHGQLFISRIPSAEDIGEFLGEPARQPLRVYVGMNAASTPEERARLALRELIRVGGFERSVLLLITPTGSGWVEPAAISTFEYLHRGDVASVGAQYSYLPSHLSLIMEGAYRPEMAQALFNEIYGYWTRLPENDRPKLYLHALSLGVVNSELSFHLHDILDDPFHGALWAGPPFRSRIWSDVTANRRPDTPQWLPIYRNGSIVRFMNQYVGLHRSDANWGPLRIAYLQHGSDPVTFFSVQSALREPEWLQPPRAPDVSPALRWYPLVTMLQLATDMAAGGDVVPPGYGHNFAARSYIHAWHALTEPEGWNDEEIERLAAHLRKPWKE